jgi:hypothetical protein
VPQPVQHPPRQEPPSPSFPLSPKPGVSRGGVFLLLASSGLLLVLFLSLAIASWPQAFSSPSSGQSAQPLLLKSDQTTFSTLHLSADLGKRALIYARSDGILLVPVDGSKPHLLDTPGYHYDHAVPPLLTPSGQLLYSGSGIWQLDPLVGKSHQLASLPTDRVITSLVLSSDGTSLAWSSVPRDGKGSAEIYAGSLTQTTRIYQRATNQCPCLRVFAWSEAAATGSDEHKTLLLTDDYGAAGSFRTGLWQLALNGGQVEAPRQLLPDLPPQGPLILTAQTNRLLYTSTWGYVPVAQDGSVPSELATESYANDLLLAHLDNTAAQLQTPQTIVASQPLHEVQITREPVHYQSTPTTMDYHWITTPRFSPTESQLAYVQFTSNRDAPFKRQSSLYLVDVRGNGTLFRAQVQATVLDGYFELGTWLDSSTITLSFKNALYALNIQQGTLAKIADVGGYGMVVGSVARL